MNRIQLIAALLALSAFECLCSAAATQRRAPLVLFTAGESAAWNTESPDAQARYGSRDLPVPGVPSCHAIPASASSTASNPQIKIVAPTLDKPLTAPLDIDLQFLAAAGAAIKPDSFRVCYLGFVTVDITKRITDHVAVSALGLHVAGAQLPRGHHHLVMLIADQQGKIGSRDAVFDIQ
jgi:hypothetical protein